MLTAEGVPDIVAEGVVNEVPDIVEVGVGVEHLVAVFEGVILGVPETEGVAVIVDVGVNVLLAV